MSYEESKHSLATINTTYSSSAEKGSSIRKVNKADINIIMLATVIDQTIDQIFMLNGGKLFHPKPEIQTTNKQELFIEDPIFDHETGKPYEVAFKEKMCTKIADTSVKFSTFIALQKEELIEHKTYELSRKKLTNYNEQQEEHEHLFAQEKINFAKMNALKETLLTETRDSQQQIQNLSEVLSTINDETQIILFRDMLRCRYMTEWEKSRNEQNLLFCKQKEKELQTIIDSYRTEIEKEIRINAEIEMYILGNHEEMEYQIEEWMEKYDKETESRNIEIQMLKEKREDQVLAYKDLQETYEEHKEAIENYLEYKDRGRREAEYREMLENMATRIQAWWRGLMVRLKLGPFNPKKGKKGKKGKDNKAGKKK